jgi:hypothetical protein
MTKYEQMKKDHQDLAYTLSRLHTVRDTTSLSVEIKGAEKVSIRGEVKNRYTSAVIPEGTLSADEEDQISQLLDTLIWAREEKLQVLQAKLDAVEELLK